MNLIPLSLPTGITCRLVCSSASNPTKQPTKLFLVLSEEIKGDGVATMFAGTSVRSARDRHVGRILFCWPTSFFFPFLFCCLLEGKIGRFLVKNARDRHVGGMPSKLPENVDGRFILLVFETSRE
jgi:hypothetical protein